MWISPTLPLVVWLAVEFPPPTVDRQFVDLDGWIQKAPHGKIRTTRSRDAENAWVGELALPGDPRLGPRDRVGPSRWPVELRSEETVHFGSYRARLRFASCAPNEEVVSAFFVYANDGEDRDGNGIVDNPEIDVEVLCGEPHLLWMTVWTDYQRRDGHVSCRKQTRVVDMRDGTTRDTLGGSLCSSKLEAAGRVEAIRIPDFPGDRFYEIGFDWFPDRIEYFLVLDGSRVPLWLLDDPSKIPDAPVQMRLQLWHASSHWDRGGAADYPARDARLRVDWARYWAG